MSLSDAKQCTKSLDRQHSRSLSVDHANDAMLGRVPEPPISPSDIMVLKATKKVKVVFM